MRAELKRFASAGLMLGLGVALVRSSAGCSVVLGTNDYQVSGCASSANALDASKRDRLVRACMYLYGCHPWLPNQRISECVTYDVPELFTYWSASLGAKTCADIQAARGVSWARSGDCPSDTSPSHCDGSRAISCGKFAVNHGIVTDCKVGGGVCTTYTAGDGKSYADCQVGSGTCSGTTDGCDGNNYYSCIGGKKIGTECDKLNSDCETRSGSTSCYFRAPKCATPGADCDGTVLVDCSDGHELRYDCGGAGLGCKTIKTADSSTVYCLAPSCGADEIQTCEESCDEDGEHANICVGGSPFKVDCVALGFKRCKQYSASKSIDRPYILCQEI